MYPFFSGHFVTESDVEKKVQNMVDARHALLDRLEYEQMQHQKEHYVAKPKKHVTAAAIPVVVNPATTK